MKLIATFLNYRMVLASLLCWSLITGADLSAQQPSEYLQAGAATSNITPELGGEIIGGFLPIPAKHIHDDLHARCLSAR